MTHEEIVREQFAATENRADWPRAMAFYDEAAVLIAGEGMQAPGTYYGKDAIGRWFADWLNTFEDARFDIREFRQGTDALALSAKHTARGKGSGIALSVELYYAYWFRAGKVVRIEVHFDRESAWRAAGVAG